MDQIVPHSFNPPHGIYQKDWSRKCVKIETLFLQCQILNILHRNTRTYSRLDIHQFLYVLLRGLLIAPTVIAPRIISPTIIAPTIIAPTIIAPMIIAPTIIAPTIDHCSDDHCSLIFNKVVYEAQNNYLPKKTLK